MLASSAFVASPPLPCFMCPFWLRQLELLVTQLYPFHYQFIKTISFWLTFNIKKRQIALQFLFMLIHSIYGANINITRLNGSYLKPEDKIRIELIAMQTNTTHSTKLALNGDDRTCIRTWWSFRTTFEYLLVRWLLTHTIATYLRHTFHGKWRTPSAMRDLCVPKTHRRTLNWCLNSFNYWKENVCLSLRFLLLVLDSLQFRTMLD